MFVIRWTIEDLIVTKESVGKEEKRKDIKRGAVEKENKDLPPSSQAI